MTSALSLSRNIVHQVLDNLFTAITEHRWQEALSLLPPVVAFTKYRVSPYFTWKVLHITMANTHIPLGVQMQILNIMLKSPIKSHTAVLDMFGYKFGDWDDDKIETMYEAIKEQTKQKESDRKMLAICRAYYALHHYLKWKQKLLLLSNESLVADDKKPDKFNERKCQKLGLKVHTMLIKAYSLSQSSSIDRNNANTDMCNNTFNHTESESIFISGKENDADNKLLCEWLLGPLLDLEIYLNIEGGSSDKSFSLNRLHGIELIEEYIKNHENHLPALRTYYFYMTTHHLEEKELIQNVLEKIVALSPESSLVLQYIHNILSDHFDGNPDESGKRKKCRLAALNQKDLFKCLKIVSNFLEYEMWRTDVRAWKVFVDILKVFHQSWIKCWDCEHCTSSRDRMVKFSDTLSSWPNILWNAFWLSSLTKEDTDVLTFAGYSAFVLGYSDQISKHCVQCLEELKCKRDIIKLVTMMKLEGIHSRDLLIYLAKQRKKRLLTQTHEKSYSSQNIVTRKGVKFGTNYVFRHLDTSAIAAESVKSIPNKNIAKVRKSDVITDNVSKNIDAAFGRKRKDDKVDKSPKSKFSKSSNLDDDSRNDDIQTCFGKNKAADSSLKRMNSNSEAYPESCASEDEDNPKSVTVEIREKTSDEKLNDGTSDKRTSCQEIKFGKKKKSAENSSSCINSLVQSNGVLEELNRSDENESLNFKKKKSKKNLKSPPNCTYSSVESTPEEEFQDSSVYEVNNAPLVKTEKSSCFSPSKSKGENGKLKKSSKTKKGDTYNSNNTKSRKRKLSREDPTNNDNALHITSPQNTKKKKFSRDSDVGDVPSKSFDNSNSPDDQQDDGKEKLEGVVFGKQASPAESKFQLIQETNRTKSLSTNNNDSSKVAFGRCNSKSLNTSNNDSSRVSFGRGNNSKPSNTSNNDSSRVSFGRGNNSKTSNTSNNDSSRVSFGRRNNSKTSNTSNNDSSRVSFGRGNNSKSFSTSNNDSRVSFGRENNSRSINKSSNDSSRVSFGRENNSKSSNTNNDNSRVSFGRGNNSKSFNTSNNDSSRVTFGRENSSRSKSLNTNSDSKVTFGSKGNKSKFNTSPDKLRRKGTYNKSVKYYNWC